MRIGLNTPDPQSTAAEQAKKPSTAVTNQPEPSVAANKNVFSQDKVTLSALASQALGLPEVRQGQVDSLRQSINNGQYHLDPHEIADAILRGRQNSRQGQ
jgi:flagellar biosynthesis anti-sigma factor FlgM